MRTWSRRDFAGGAALLALVVGAPIATLKLVASGDDEAPTDRQRALLRDVSQLTLPRTATAGAGDIAVGDFVLMALAAGLDGSLVPVASAAAPQFPRYLRRDGSIRHVPWLEEELDRHARGDFLARTAAERAGILRRVDAATYAANAVASPWKQIKSLILIGYYTSQVGASKELRYELVPGRYDNDLPLHPGDRAWSSDWTAVDFG
ncbi:gluconate 2-dehydrogenase subunit 3 family protein [Sphingomonas sp. RB3P16]|uniref:gluconate 2-dehydrogenase subunit 3 family protein n=1 Tax=Parasphingomonas frigoris TaxID=3096163 RepID=UPI002FC7498B